MSLLIGRVEIVDPMSWPEPLGEAVQRVGGVPVPGSRNGHSFSPAVELDPETGSTRTTRLRVRRQIRALMNNPLARLQGVWVQWSEDDEQSGWYVPAQASIGMSGTDGALVSGLFRIDGLSLELVGRPRTHRRAVLARIRDLRSSTEPKDTLRRVYGAAFDGSSGNGSNVTPAARVYLPSTATDVMAHSGGTPSLGTARTGRSSTSVAPVTGLSDLAVASVEQAASARLLGDAVIYDRRGETAAPPLSTGPHASWEEVHGRDWPWTGRVIIDNYIARTYISGAGAVGLEYWSGSAYTQYGAVSLRVRIASTDYNLDTVLSTNVHEWTESRCVVHLRMSNAATAGTASDVFLTMQRGWLGPRIEIYPPSGLITKMSVTGIGAFVSNSMPATMAASVNYGALVTDRALVMAAVQPSMTTALVGSALVAEATGYISLRMETTAAGAAGTLAPQLGADALAGTQYPQTIVPRSA